VRRQNEQQHARRARTHEPTHLTAQLLAQTLLSFAFVEES
jgi:hypothetical protein